LIHVDDEGDDDDVDDEGDGVEDEGMMLKMKG